MKHLALMALAIILTLSMASAQEKYDPALFADQEQSAKKYVIAKLDMLKEKNIKKVLIGECWGQFVYSTEVIDGAMKLGDRYITTTTLDPGTAYYQSMVDSVYALVERAFAENGIAVLPKDTLSQNPEYKDINLDEEEKERQQSGGLFKDIVKRKVSRVSASGLGIFTTTVGFKAIKAQRKLAFTMPKLAKDYGCDAMVTINFYVDKGDKWRPMLTRWDISMSYDFGESNAGGGKVDTYFKSGKGVLGIKKAFTNKAAGISDADQYRTALLEIFTGLGGLYKYQVGQALAK